MNGSIPSLQQGSSTSVLPDDLAELQGAVHLMHLSLEAASAALPASASASVLPDRATVARLLSVFTYALARGWYGADEIALRCGEDGCLRYLAGSPPPEATGLRRFRREHAGMVRTAFGFLVSRMLGQLDSVPRLGFDPRSEASQRLSHAVAADSLELEC